jgi:hypothetical protein
MSERFTGLAQRAIVRSGREAISRAALRSRPATA